MKLSPNLKLLPLVTALCVLVLTAVSCRHNVVLQELLRNRNKRTTQEATFPDAYYVKHGGMGDGTAYSTPFGQLKDALDAVKASNGKTDRVIVIGPLDKDNAEGLDGVAGGGGYSIFSLKNYGTQKNPITISGMSGGTLLGDNISNNGARVMQIGNNCCLRFENITFTDGKGANGGGLYIDGNSDVTLLNGARITGNTAYNGGGICVDDAKLTIDGAEISNNSGNRSGQSSTLRRGGGGLLAGGSAEVTINSGLITANETNTNGGGISISTAYYDGAVNCKVTFTMTGGTISANTATNSGGGIYVNSHERVQINGGAIYRNEVTDDILPQNVGGGGGIFVGSATSSFILKKATIDSNRAILSGGGGVCGYAPSWEIDGATITNNTSGKYGGGGVFVASGTLTYTSGAISGNNLTADDAEGKSIYCRYYGVSDSHKETTKGYVIGSIVMNFGEFRDDDINIP